MPIYAYACENCGKELEKLQKISDPVLVDCPACSGQTLKRQLTAPNFRLSGAGWYETDFKNNKDTQKNLSEYQKNTPDADTKSTKDDTSTQKLDKKSDSSDTTNSTTSNKTSKDTSPTTTSTTPVSTTKSDSSS